MFIKIGVLAAATALSVAGITATAQAKTVRPLDTSPTATFPAADQSGSFGSSVALSANGQTALIGSPFDDNGAAYLYVKTASGWPTTPTATITPPVNADWGLGMSVALSADGQTALIGAPFANHTGAAMLYTAASGWSNTPVATFTSNAAQSYFGWSVALSADGQTALAGAPQSGADLGDGAAYVFSETAGSWPTTPTATFTAPVGSNDYLGGSVALSADGQTALLGAPDAGPGNNNNGDGAAYLYTAPSGAWPTVPTATFTGVLNSDENLGNSVALSGDGQTAVAGAPFAGSTGQDGAAYLYTAASGWSDTPVATFTPTASPGGELGNSLALSDDGQTVLASDPGLRQTDEYTASPGWSNTPSATFQGSGPVALPSDGQTALVADIGLTNNVVYLYGPAATPTSTSVSSSVNPAAVGQTVTYTATVTGPSGTLPASGETVAFDDGGSAIPGCAAVELSTSAPYTAACQVSYPSTGSHSVTAAYGGDSANVGSTSSPVSQAVNRATSAASITSTTATPVVGQPISVAVQVTGQYPGSGAAAPSGSATVSDGTQSCQVSLSGSNGVATGSCQLTEQAPRGYRLTAKYGGDPNYTASHATPVKVTVAKAATTTGLTLSASSVAYGNETSLQLTATVAPQFSGTPTGQVTVVAGTVTLCTMVLSGGTGSCSPSSPTGLAIGKHTVTAHYAGDPDFKASSGRQTLTVTKS
jgi:hypothetical protein